jgi:hypothetical protein
MSKSELLKRAEKVKALSSCIWFMNKEIIERSRDSDGLLTKEISSMQECAYSVAGYLGDDPSLEVAYRYIQNENVLGVFGNSQNGFIKASWMRFCELVAIETEKDIVSGHEKTIDCELDVNLVWYLQLGLKKRFLMKMSPWKNLFKKSIFVISER